MRTVIAFLSLFHASTVLGVTPDDEEMEQNDTPKLDQYANGISS